MIATRRTRLRRATEAIHGRIDAGIKAAGFLGSRQGYAAFLWATWGPRNELENRLDAGHTQHLYEDWPARKIGALIEQDLRDVQDGNLQVVIPRRDLPTAGDAAVTTATLLGTLYVLEGSALGAKILQQRVALLGFGPKHGARHLACQTGHPGAWRSFLILLEKTPLGPAEEEACLAAAVEAFQLFERSYAAVA